MASFQDKMDKLVPERQNESRFKWGKEMIGFGDGSGISWTICKQSAPCSRQITTPTPHHWIFTGQMLFPMLNQQCESMKAVIVTVIAMAQKLLALHNQHVASNFHATAYIYYNYDDLSLKQTDSCLKSLQANWQIFQLLFTDDWKPVEKTWRVDNEVIEKCQHALWTDRINLERRNTSCHLSAQVLADLAVVQL